MPAFLTVPATFELTDVVRPRPKERRRAAEGELGIDAVIIDLARRAGWVVHARELAAIGCAPDALLLRVRRQLLQPLFRGVYLVGRSSPTADERLRAALLTGPGSVLTGRAAASHYGWLRLGPNEPVEVASVTARRKQKGLIVRKRKLAAHDVTIRRGLPTTTVAATLGEVAKSHRVAELVRFVHEAESRKQLSLAAVARWLDDHPRAHGAEQLRGAIGRHRPLVGSVGSALEQRFHRFLSWADLPPTEHNVRFDLAAAPVSVDVLFRSAWLAVEVDGGPHQSALAFQRDRIRDRRLEAEFGLTVLRVTSADLRGDWKPLAAQLWATLARRDRSLVVPARFR